MPRILYALKLQPGDKFGSLEEQACILADAIKRDGGELVALFTEDRAGPLDEYKARGIDAYYLDLTRFRLKTARALTRIIEDHKIDIVHWNMQEPVRNPYLWYITLRNPSVRHQFTDHISRPANDSGAAKGLVQALKSLALRRYEKIVCVSQFIQKSHEPQSANLDVQYHFVNVERFCPDRVVRQRIRAEEHAGENLVALLVANLIPQKGVDVALRALAALPSSVCLWIVGQGPEQDKIARQCTEHGISDRVRMLGPKAHVESYMQAADLLLCPSLWGEAAGLVNLEAQACGLPVVASRIGGIPEHVVDERTGLLFEPGDSTDLARQLNRLMQEPGLLQRLSSAARPWVIESFSPVVRVPEFLDRYSTSGAA